MADRLVLVAANIGVGNASSASSAVYSMVAGSSQLQVRKDAGGEANVRVQGSFESNSITSTQIVATTIQSDTLTTSNLSIDGSIAANSMTIGNSASVSNVFRVEPGNVILGEDAFIQAGSQTLSSTRVVGRQSMDTGILTANTIVANGINVVDAIQSVMKSSIRYYVKTSGSDTNDGRSWDSAFATITHAASVAGSYSTIYVESGEYVIDNPVYLKRRVSLVGDNLRSTRVKPLNPKNHLFFVDDLCYIVGFRFIQHRRPSFCISFPCCIAEAEVQFQRLSAINVLHSPTGYSNVPPVVVVEAPESSTGQAPTATSTLNESGQVGSITLITSGDLYPGTTPTVTVGKPQLSVGIQPSVTASITGGSVNGFNIVSPGTAYLTAPTVTISPPSGAGVQATATATLDVSGYLQTINLQEAGSGYLVAPSVTVSAPPSIQATATITMNFQGQYGNPVSFTVTNPGSGYSSAPTITVSPPESIQATAEANVVNGVVDAVIITNPGSGYTNLFARPHISIPPPTSKRAFITGSPYIQNCSSITGAFNRRGEQLSVLPPYDTVVYDVDETGAGGGCLVDGWVTHVNSPLRSMVCDSFTQVNQGGPGHLIVNTGYAQFVSCFTTFCTYSYRSVGGGTTNISTSVTDFGNYGLVATGYWPTPIATGTISNVYRSEVASVVIPEGKGGSGYTSPPTVVFSSGGATGTATLLADRVDSVLVTSPGAYEETPTVSFVGGGGSGAAGTVQMTNPSPIRMYNATGRKPDQGSVVRHRGVWQTVVGASFITNGVYDVTLYPGIFTADPGETLEFFVGSTVGTGQHVMEYAGSGVTYNALLEYGGQPNEGNQIYEVFPGRVFYCLTDHLGNQSIGKYFAVEQLTGAVTLNTDKFSLSGLQAIGPFKRGGNPAGVQLEEVSNDVRLIDSTGIVGATTAPTQFAVKTYVDARSLKPAGTVGDAYVKNSNNDYDASWVPVVLESEKGQPLGVAGLDAQGRIVGDGSVIANTNASSLSLGTVSQSVLPITIGNVSTQFVGNGVSISHTNASNVKTGTLPGAVFPVTIGDSTRYLQGNGVGISALNGSNVVTGFVPVSRIGTGTPTGFGGNVVLSTSPTLELGTTITGVAPTVVFQDTNHNSAFIECNNNKLSVLRGATNATSSTQVNGQWPMILDLTNNDCTFGGNVNAVGDVAAYASDRRLKCNIRPVSETPLEDIQRLQGVRFEWNPETPQPMRGTDVGLIAQDVQSILPEAVRPAPFDYVDGKSVSGNEYLTIDSGNKLVSLLVECIKQLHRRLENLEN
jgi:hypothetical protein